MNLVIITEALRIHQSLADIIKAMFITTNPIPVKYAAVVKIGYLLVYLICQYVSQLLKEAAYIDKALIEYLQ